MELVTPAHKINIFDLFVDEEFDTQFPKGIDVDELQDALNEKLWELCPADGTLNFCSPERGGRAWTLSIGDDDRNINMTDHKVYRDRGQVLEDLPPAIVEILKALDKKTITVGEA